MTRTNDIDRFAEQVGFPARRAFSDLSDLYPRLERFAALVAAYTLTNIDPSKFMSHQDGLEAGRLIEREAILDLVDAYAKNNTDLKAAIKARGQA